MNKCYLLLESLLCLLFIGCGQGGDNMAYIAQHLKDNYKLELTYEKDARECCITQTELPFNLHFGMTSEEVIDTIKLMMNQGIIQDTLRTNNTIQYFCQLQVQGYDIRGSFELWYFENQLYALHFRTAESIKITKDLINAFRVDISDQYSSFQNYKRVDYILNTDAKFYSTAWFVDNMKIGIEYSQNDCLCLYYVNEPVSALKLRQQKSSDYNNYNTNTGTAKVVNSPWNGSVHQVTKYLESHLYDPSSYKSIEWSEVQTTENGYIVRHKYRAKNGFGGYVISNQIFILNKQGQVIGVEGL